MSETEQQKLEAEVIDPPDNQGGETLNAEGGTEIVPLDPPEGNGGGGGGVITPVNNP